MMGTGLLFCLCSAIVGAFGEEQLEHGWQEGGRECVWAEVMENRARMGGGSGLLATQTVPQGLSSCWNMLSVLSFSRNLNPDTPSYVLSPSSVPLLTSSQTLPTFPSLFPCGKCT